MHNSAIPLEDKFLDTIYSNEKSGDCRTGAALRQVRHWIEYASDKNYLANKTCTVKFADQSAPKLGVIAL